MSSLRVIVLSGADLRALAHLVRRIHRQAPHVTVCGVLYQEPLPPKRFRRRVASVSRTLPECGYMSYIIARALAHVRRQLARLGHGVLRLAHACPPVRHQASRQARDELVRACESVGCALHIARDIHSVAALEFVRSLHPDLGVVWGTRLLKSELFNLPRLGSINIHRKKVPEYRGSGPTGMWELLDRQREVGITIHRVEAALDAGPVLDCTTVPIEHCDTLATLDRKVHVAGDDLLVSFLVKAAAGEWRPIPQVGAVREFRKPAPHHLRQYTKQIEAERPPCRTEGVHGVPALLVRTLWWAPYMITRNWQRRLRRSFPIVVLRYDGVVDSPASTGIPLNLLLKHLAFLRKHYRVVSLDEAEALLAHGRITMPTVVLTFDGESKDTFVNLRAALGEIGHGAALFVSARDAIDADAWSHVVHLSQHGVDIGARLRAGEPLAASKMELERLLGREVRYACLPDQTPATSPRGVFDIVRTAYRCVVSDEGIPNWPSSGGSPRHLSRCRHANNLWELELILQGCRQT